MEEFIKNLTKQERTFTAIPIGVKYICEFCSEGEMIYMETADNLYAHQCDKCKKTMLLPKIYPYIEWIKKE